jgi:hypothetical protein
VMTPTTSNLTFSSCAFEAPPLPSGPAFGAGEL